MSRSSAGPRPPPDPKSRGTVRIVGGRWKRTPLAVVDGPGLRPTPDRVRETLFNWLVHAFDGDLTGRSALDLFAGSGALGIEAASRGAHPVVLVERNVAAVAVLASLRQRLAGALFVVEPGDAIASANRLIAAGRQFDIVFLDPPFGTALLAAALPLAVALCRPAGFVYVETDRPFAAADGLSAFRADKAGEVFYHLLQRKI